MPDTDELTFKKGDIFFVHNDMDNGWLWVTAHRTGEQGNIPFYSYWFKVFKTLLNIFRHDIP